MQRTGIRFLILLALLFAGTGAAYAAESGGLAFSVRLDNASGAAYAFCAAYGRDGRMLAVSSIPITATEQRVELPCGREETGSVRIFTLDFSIRTEARYPSVYDTLADYAKNEKDTGTLPKLADRIENFGRLRRVLHRLSCLVVHASAGDALFL